MTRDGDSPIYGTRDSYLLDLEIFLGMTSQRQSGEIKETDSQMPFSPMLSAPSGLAAKVCPVAAALRRRLLRFPKIWIDARSWQLTMNGVLAINSEIQVLLSLQHQTGVNG